MASGVALRGSETHVVELSLSGANKALAFGVRFRSLVGRHSLTDVYAKDEGVAQVWRPLDRLSAELWLIDSIYSGRMEDEERIELISRVLESHRVMASYVKSALSTVSEVPVRATSTFIQSEQSAVFGHWLHPTPKSRQGFLSWHHDHYAPELAGKFQLHFFAVASDLVSQVSLVDAAEEIAHQIARSGANSINAPRGVNPGVGYCLLPVHPLQAHWLLHQKHVLKLIESGQMRDIGRLGAFFTPTSSVRTVYSEELDFMVKLSIPVKLTNSLRQNLRTELDDSVWVSKLCRELNLRREYPTLHILEDPAYLTVDVPGLEESGFEVIFRENPFVRQSVDDVEVHSIAALVQDPVIPGSRSAAAQLIVRVAAASEVSEQQAALLWFESYFEHAIRVPIELLERHGIALEGHQQNALLAFDTRGLPVRSLYRDIQGLSLLESRRAELTAIVPELAQLPKLFEPDEIVQDGFGYYLFFNQLYSVVNRLALDSFLDEVTLLNLIATKLEALRGGMLGSGRILIDAMLSMESMPCKANLLTRVADVDELEEENELGVYTAVPNPLCAPLRSGFPPGQSRSAVRVGSSHVIMHA